VTDLFHVRAYRLSRGVRPSPLPRRLLAAGRLHSPAHEERLSASPRLAGDPWNRLRRLLAGRAPRARGTGLPGAVQGDRAAPRAVRSGF
jgi:hypothetical protein